MSSNTIRSTHTGAEPTIFGRSLHFVAHVALLGCVLAGPASAVAGGSYFGHVTGPVGVDAFDDVEVALTGSGLFRATTPNTNGAFVFYDLPDGQYAVKVRKPGYSSSPARPIRIENGAVTAVDSNFVNTRFELQELDPETFVFHWEEDQSTAGYDYSSSINEPLSVEIFDQESAPFDSSAALVLKQKYGIILVNSDEMNWTHEHAYRLRETMRSIPQKRISDSIWKITPRHLADDISINILDTSDILEVLISERAFLNANPRIALVEGKRGRYFSRRLHHALVRYVTNQGKDEGAVNRILENRFGVTTWLSDGQTHESLTQHTTREDSRSFQRFHAEELVQIINTMEEMPSGMHKIPELRYLLRRRDGLPHPLYSAAPAVAWTAAGYIEFMDKAFLSESIHATHRLIIHEKGHFLWDHLFDQPLRSAWIAMGDWYRDPNSPSGWSTRNQTEFVSAYAHNISPEEDMAESIAYFVVNPDKLRSRSIRKYEFIRDHIMQGSIYISDIRDDLKFRVYNLYPDYVFPGKIRRVDITIQGAPREDKRVRIEIELHALDLELEGAELAFMRISNQNRTYIDRYFYPVDVPRGESGTILATEFTMSKFAKSGYWFPRFVLIWDMHGNERHATFNDFGWNMQLINPLEDIVPPRYVRNSAVLLKSVAQSDGRQVQAIVAEWRVVENTEMDSGWACGAAMNDQIDDTYRLFEWGRFDLERGVCRVVFKMPEYMASSTYSLDYIVMKDLARNRSTVRFGEGHAAEAPQMIEITTVTPDYTAPRVDLNNISISAVPVRPDAPDGETLVTIDFRSWDDISGVATWFRVYLRDPQGLKHHNFCKSTPTVGQIESGGLVWDLHRCRIVLPRGSAPGVWGLAELAIEDMASNGRRYDFTEIMHFVVEP